MGWLSSLFSSNGASNARRGQAMSSTHEAFSLPTHSPVSTHPDAFNPDNLRSPDADALMSPAYSYPPQGGSYGYLPTTGRSQPAPLLPVHHDNGRAGPSSYPPLSTTWGRIRSWLNSEYPELGDTLNYGILPQDLAQIEMQLGFSLPQSVRDSYLLVDGQEAESAAGCNEGLFFGLVLLPLDEVLEEWRFWREVDDDPTTGANPRLHEMMQSLPTGWIRKEYSQRGWIPLIADKTGNYIGVDLTPAEGGCSGQVIVFGRDFDTKVVLWRGDGIEGWGKWLANFADELEAGDVFEIGDLSDGEGSEDDIGYESYYHDGTGRGQGDGGGDSGMRGGLRLTGEYRGWNVMEAWADRSLRRWYEAGVISDTAPVSSTVNSTQDVDMGALNLSDHASQVPIPILDEVEDTIPAPPPHVAAPSPPRSRRPRPEHPALSVNKPPAPLPVELPSPRDMSMASLPSPPDSTHSGSFDDIAHGRGPTDEETGLVSSRVQSPPLQIDPPPTGIPLPASPDSLSPKAVTSPTTQTRTPDLLADLAPETETTPIKPSVQTVDLVNTDVEPEEAKPGIRLVGGSAAAAPVPVSVPTEEEPAPAVSSPVVASKEDDTASVSSVTSVQSKKAHKKNKSSGLASLKKFGLGRKKSVESIKDAGK